jgi:hypothetical protein
MDNGGSGDGLGMRGRGGAYGPQPSDEQSGGWTREQRERMDEKFRAAFERALRSGQESKTAAAATVHAERRRSMPRRLAGGPEPLLASAEAAPVSAIPAD